eukprot:1085426-Rhodomonas_salina.2
MGGVYVACARCSSHVTSIACLSLLIASTSLSFPWPLPAHLSTQCNALPLVVLNSAHAYPLSVLDIAHACPVSARRNQMQTSALLVQTVRGKRLRAIEFGGGKQRACTSFSSLSTSALSPSATVLPSWQPRTPRQYRSCPSIIQ